MAHSLPTPQTALLFRAKATVLQIRRLLKSPLQPRLSQYSVRAFELNPPTSWKPLAQSRTPLHTATDGAEAILEAGKIHNLRLALRRIHRLEVPAHHTFSFWQQVGMPSRWRGYAVGREIREGCVIPSIGGGLCQLSNALYDAALQAGMEIVERHAHTQIVPGSLAEVGRDATVFWNYVDLRFRAPYPFVIQATLGDRWLDVRFWAAADPAAPLSHGYSPATPSLEAQESSTVPLHNCLTCNTTDCFRHAQSSGLSTRYQGRTAVLVDEYWPEFDRYLTQTRQPTDLLFVPLKGKDWKKANYAWNTKGVAQVRQSWGVALQRAWRSRQLAQQGAPRQQAFLHFAQTLARQYSAHLTYDITHLVVMQPLLPWLWQAGHLAGRTFDVLMTALPLAQLQARLDEAAVRHPSSTTLQDFRTDSNLVHLEVEALAQARTIITPHPDIAALYGERAVLLDWVLPTVQPPSLTVNLTRQPPLLVFPASTLGRKGAYELRAATANLSLTLRVVGAELEGDNFWDSIPIEHVTGRQDWYRDAAAVVLPAWVEHNPRRLLEAVAQGIPVIASKACGVENIPGVITVTTGDVGALHNALRNASVVPSEHLYAS